MPQGTFSLDITRFVQKAKGRVDIVVRKIALDIFKRVIMKSPVDTGRFKGNWQVAIGSIPAGTIVLDDIVGKEGAKTDRRSAARSALAGQVSMSRVQAEVLGLKAGDVITLINNLSYARALEYGHSKQAPQGMVRLTLEEFPGVVRRATGEAKNES